jgi:hypothetical protein
VSALSSSRHQVATSTHLHLTLPGLLAGSCLVPATAQTAIRASSDTPLRLGSRLTAKELSKESRRVYPERFRDRDELEHVQPPLTASYLAMKL